MDDTIPSSNTCPINGAPPGSAEVLHPDWMRKHDGKIPTVHSCDRKFMCDLFLNDVKIREKVKEFIAETPVKEKLINRFF